MQAISKTEGDDQKSETLAQQAAPANGIDQFTFANINEITTQHVHMKMDVDFESQTITGLVQHKMKVDKSATNGINKVVLDVQGMQVSKAQLISSSPSTATLVQIDKGKKKIQQK